MPTSQTTVLFKRGQDGRQRGAKGAVEGTLQRRCGYFQAEKKRGKKKPNDEAEIVVGGQKRGSLISTLSTVTAKEKKNKSHRDSLEQTTQSTGIVKH